MTFRSVALALIAFVALAQIKPEAADYFQRGLAAIRAHNFTEAESLIAAGLKIDPNSPAGYDLLGVAADQVGNSADAEKCFRKAISLNPHFVSAHNDLGRSLYHRGLVDPAIQEFRIALRFDPRNFTSNFNLGLIYRERKQFAQAIPYLETARTLLPADVPTLLALTDAYFGAKETEKGLALSHELAASDPGDPQIDFSLGTLLLQQKQYSQATELLERARAAVPRNYDLLHDLGQAYTHIGKYPAAEDAFLAALNINNDAIETQYQLAIAYAQWKRADQAIQVLVRARELAPNRPDILLLLGRLCIQEGFIDDAIEVLQRCASIDPDKVEPHLLLGEAFTKRKQYEKALPEYEIMARLDPKNPQSYVSLGRTYEYLRQYTEGQQALAKALAIDPKNTQGLYYMGRIAGDQNDYTGAKHWYAQVLAIDPKHLAALYDMAVTLMYENSNEPARQYLEKAIAVEPTFSQLYYRLSVVERRLNHSDQAAQAFATFQKYDEADRQRQDFHAYGVLDFLKETQDLSETERLQKYRDALLKTAETHPDDVNVLFMQAQVYFGLHNDAKAIDNITKICSLQPDNVGVRLRAASLLTRFNHYAEALAQLKTALESHPENNDVRFALAALGYRLRRFSEARETLSSPASLAAHNLLGRILIYENKTEAGLNELRAAVGGDPNNDGYIADLAIELAASGQISKARAELQKARAKYPVSVRLLFAEGICYQLSGHPATRNSFEKAAELSVGWQVPLLANGDLDRAAALFPDSPWPHWLKWSQTSSPQTELDSALALAPAQPAIYPAILASLVQRGECTHAQEVWARMKPLMFSLELDPLASCTKSPVPDYPPWRWIVELSRE